MIGSWSISFGGGSYEHFDSASRESGIFSCDGYLVLAQRSSFFMAMGVRLPGMSERPPVRRTFPWSIQANMTISPGMLGWRPGNGVIDRQPRSIFPGLLINLQDAATHGEWYNRGVAVQWLLLATVAAVFPAIAFVGNYRRGLREGRCVGCGYDLRATPERCPECGRVAAQSRFGLVRSELEGNLAAEAARPLRVMG